MATNNGEPQSGETSAEFELPESMTAETEDGRTVTFKLVGVLSDEETIVGAEYHGVGCADCAA